MNRRSLVSDAKDDVEVMNQKDNADEDLAENWLRQQGYRDIRRPCSDPPDFVVNGDTAVEVTRLNQRIRVRGDNDSRGVEQSQEPLTECMDAAIDELGPPGNKGKSWLIDCTFDWKDPLPRKKIVKKQVQEALAPLTKPYDDGVVRRRRSLECGLCLQLTEIQYHPEQFLLQNVSDGQGILVADELRNSIRNRIDKKSERVRTQNRVGEYSKWWLILVDHVCLAPIQVLSEHEMTLIRDQDGGFWSRVTIISSRNPCWHYDLLPFDGKHGPSLPLGSDRS